MTFKFACPHCGQHIVATSPDSGHDAPCPACGMSLLVPTIVDGSLPPDPKNLTGRLQIANRIPVVLAVTLCSIVSSAVTFFLATHLQSTPDKQEAKLAAQAANVPVLGQPGVSAASAGQSIAARSTGGSHRVRGITDASARERAPGGETGIWPTIIYPGESLPAPDDTLPDEPEMDEKGLAVMQRLNAAASAVQNPKLAAEASEKMRFLIRAFNTEVRTKLPVYQEMRDAIQAGDDSEFHRQANTVNAIAVFNNGTSLCTKDELLELATLLQVVMDAKSSFEQKDPMELMQAFLDQARARKAPLADTATSAALPRN